MKITSFKGRIGWCKADLRLRYICDPGAGSMVVAGGKTTVSPAAAGGDSMALWIADKLTVPAGSGAPFINNSALSPPIAATVPGNQPQ